MCRRRDRPFLLVVALLEYHFLDTEVLCHTRRFPAFFSPATGAWQQLHSRCPIKSISYHIIPCGERNTRRGFCVLCMTQQALFSLRSPDEVALQLRLVHANSLVLV